MKITIPTAEELRAAHDAISADGEFPEATLELRRLVLRNPLLRSWVLRTIPLLRAADGEPKACWRRSRLPEQVLVLPVMLANLATQRPILPFPINYVSVVAAQWIAFRYWPPELVLGAAVGTSLE